MTFTESTLAALATQLPGAAGVLRRHQLDFCCRGTQTLAEACARRGLDPASIAAELSALAQDPSEPTLELLARLSAAELVDHIERRYHEPLRPDLAHVLTLAVKVERRHGGHPDCPHGLAVTLERAAIDLESHLAKEEQVLFPAVRRGATGLTGPVSVMLAEHEEHGEMLGQMRRLARSFQPPEGVCSSWRALYLDASRLERELREHILIENHLLFPRIGAPT